MGSIASSFNKGVDDLRISTGKTGDELKGLVDTARGVAADVVQPFEAVADVVGKVAIKTGLTGKPLDDLSTRMLTLARVTKQDAGVAADAFLTTLAKWKIPIEDAAGAMDRLLRISQDTGTPITKLLDSVNAFSGPLKAFGFDLDTSAALAGILAKSGANVDAVFAAMKVGLTKLSKGLSDEVPPAFKGAENAWNSARASLETGDTATAFKVLGDSIRNATNDTEARARAIEIFGGRAGPALAAALRGGAAGVDVLTAKIRAGGDTVKGAGDDTLRLGDQLTILKNKVVAGLGPFSQQAAVFATIAAGVGPVGTGIAKLGPIFATVGKAGLALFTSPLFLAIAALIVITLLIIKNWDTVKAALIATWEFIKTAASAVFDFLKMIFLNFTPLGLIIQHWETIKTALVAVWEFIKSAAIAVFDFLKMIFLNFTPIGLIIQHWETIKAFLTGAWNLIRNVAVGVFTAVRDFIVGVFSAVASFISSAVSSIKNFIVNGFNAALGFIRSVLGNIKSAVITGFNAVVSFVAGIPGRILGALGSLGSILTGAGRALMEGLLRGIKAAAQAVFDFVKGIASKIASLKGPIDKDKILLRPHGEAIMEGLATGILNGMDHVIAIASDAASRVAAAVTAGASKTTLALEDIVAGILGEGRLDNLVNFINALPDQVRFDFVPKILDQIRGMIEKAGFTIFEDLSIGKFTPRALGGPVFPRGNYLVGERGPEMLSVGARGNVFSNDVVESIRQLVALLSGRQNLAPVINIHEVAGSPDATARAVMDRLGQAMQR